MVRVKDDFGNDMEMPTTATNGKESSHHFLPLDS